MKKKIMITFISIVIIIIAFTNYVQAENQITSNNTNDASNSQIKNQHNDIYNETNKIEDNVKIQLKTVEDYAVRYGSQGAGICAYALEQVRKYSLPVGFVLIIIVAIKQYSTSLKENRNDKGIFVISSIVVIMIIAQVLPLIYLIVIKGWGE